MYVRARKGIGYLPQEPSIFRGLTVEQNILAILETLDRSTRRRGGRGCGELLAELNLTPLAQAPGLHAVGRRAAAGRDHARAGRLAAVHPARRAVRRHRSDRGRRHPEDHLPPEGAGHRRADHRPQRARDAAHHRPRVHRARRRDLPERHAGRAWRPTRTCGGFTSGPSSGWTKIGYGAWRGRRRQTMAIQQKLHTKLVQKLILTPSLQQAIKLLPMSTLELGDLLNQEMVENPMLEEVPTEELQAGRRRRRHREAGARRRRNRRPTPGTTRTTSTSSATTSTTATGRARRRRSRSCRRSRTRSRPRRRCPITCSGSSRSRPTTTLMREIGTAIIGNLDDDGYLVASVDEIAAMGTWPVADVERALAAGAGLRSDRRRRARPAGVPAAAAPAPRPRGHADREDRHRAPAPAAEPPGARARAQARPADRGAQAAHRDHPAPRSEAGQPLQPRRSRSTSSPTSTSSRSRTSTSRC